MSTTIDALTRAIDSLEELAAEPGEPQGAIHTAPVAPINSLQSQGRGHRGHRGHTKVVYHGRSRPSDSTITAQAERPQEAPAQRMYLSGVAPVAPVEPTIDSKEKYRGHTLNPCGPLWPLAGLPGISACSDIPAEWLEGVARLTGAPAPRTYPASAWQQLIVDAGRFLDRWAAQAAALDWPDWELFGCHRRAPWGRIQGMGLVLLLRGKELAAMTAAEAVIRTPTGARQIYYRHPHDPLHSAERSLIWELG